MIRRPPALDGTDFEKILGGEHGYEKAGPVGDRVPEERSEMRAGIGSNIENDPGQQDEAGHEAQGVAVEEGRSCFAHHGSMTGVKARLLLSGTDIRRRR